MSPARRAAVTGVAGGLGLAATSGVAYAFWSATGTGSGTVSSASAQLLTVSAAATPVTDLYPGRTVDLGFSVANPNGYRVRLSALAAASVTSSDPAACPASSIALGAPGPLPTPVEVAGGGTASGTVPGLVTMVAAAPDGCQGKTFTVALTLTGSQY